MSHEATSPDSKPMRNHLTRCAELPWVKLSGNHPAAALALDAVITDGCSRIEGLLEVTRLEHIAGALGVETPDPGHAVRLEFEPHRQLVGLRLAGPPLLRLHLLVDAKQVLHVVADLVSDDVGLGKIAWSTEAALELVIES